MNAVMSQPPVPVTADPATELVRLMRRLTPKQRRLLRMLPECSGQFWAAVERCGFSKHSAHRWMRRPGFVRARELIEQRALDEIGITHAYVLGTTKQVVERCMQEGELREGGALKGLELLGRYRRLWGNDEANRTVAEGPGLQIFVNAPAGNVAIHAEQGTHRGVLVQLPEPEK